MPLISCNTSGLRYHRRAIPITSSCFAYIAYGQNWFALDNALCGAALLLLRYILNIHPGVGRKKKNLEVVGNRFHLSFERTETML